MRTWIRHSTSTVRVQVRVQHSLARYERRNSTRAVPGGLSPRHQTRIQCCNGPMESISDTGAQTWRGQIHGESDSHHQSSLNSYKYMLWATPNAYVRTDFRTDSCTVLVLVPDRRGGASSLSNIVSVIRSCPSRDFVSFRFVSCRAVLMSCTRTRSVLMSCILVQYE